MTTKDTFYDDRLKEVRDNLCIGDETHMGGEGLKNMLVPCLIGNNTLDIETIFASITHLYREKERMIEDGSIFPVRYFEETFSPKEHMVYPCLDNDLKFGMFHYGEDDWKNVLYVFARLNTDTGWKIKNKEL